VRLDSDSDPTVFTLDLPASTVSGLESSTAPFSRENDAHETEHAPQAS
jgi:hypothetical protein